MAAILGLGGAREAVIEALFADPDYLYHDILTCGDVPADPDPLVECFLEMVRTEILYQACNRWVSLRHSNEALFVHEMDVITYLSSPRVGFQAITPFPPLTNYLEKWAKWRLESTSPLGRPPVSGVSGIMAVCDVKIMWAGTKALRHFKREIKLITRPKWYREELTQKLENFKTDIENLFGAQYLQDFASVAELLPEDYKGLKEEQELNMEQKRKKKEELALKKEARTKKKGEQALKKESPLKKKEEQALKKESPLKKEPAIKEESRIKEEPATKKESPIKKEPAIKEEPDD